jgi:hypothetical protein
MQIFEQKNGDFFCPHLIYLDVTMFSVMVAIVGIE